MKNLWERHIFIKLWKFIILFLIGIFLIFFIIDFSIHSNKLFSSKTLLFKEIFLYYYHNFIFDMNLFCCLSFMLGIIKVIYTMNIKNELLVLQTAGISLYKITRPLFVSAFLLFILSGINFQFLLPKSYMEIENFKNNYTRRERKEKPNPNTILLNDGSKLIYLKLEKNIMTDVFLIKSFDDIWHMKSLDLNSNEAYYVDHFIRDEKLKKIDSFKKYFFPQTSSFQQIKNPIEYQSFLSLISKKIHNQYLSKKEKREVTSHIHHKIISSSIFFLIVIALFPYLVRFSKNNNFFMIITFSLFSFFAFYTIVGSCVILSENSLGKSFLILWGPVFLPSIFFIGKFLKILT